MRHAGRSIGGEKSDGVRAEAVSYRRAVLGRMIAGLLLSMSGLLLALLSQSVSARAPADSGLERGSTWVALLAALVIATVVVGYLRSSRQRPKSGDSNGHNLPAARAEPDFRLESGASPFKADELLREMDRHLAHSRKEGREFSVLAIALDTESSDVAAADAQIEQLSQSLSGLTRSRGAKLLRCEQPEFVVLANDLMVGQAVELGKDLTWAVADLAMPLPEAPKGIVTISVGVAAGYAEPDRTASAYLDAARKALSDARRQGGNRVCSELL
jgi:GGDEF domain-containing protein